MRKTRSTALFKSGWMIVAVILLVAVFLSLNWYHYRRTRRSLEDDLSFRLKAVASLVSSGLKQEDIALLNPDELSGLNPGGIEGALASVSEEFSLSNILILREDGVTLFSIRPDLYPPGDVYPHWSMDYPAIINALEGAPEATELYRAPDGTYLKAGYAPVPLGVPRAGTVVAVEASAGFLKGLQDQRNILLVATAISVVGIVLFTGFVLKATGSLIRARESLIRAETLASMGRMAAGIAHEIRNPLFIIRSSAEKIKETYPEDSEEIDTFILEEVDRLNRTLKDYLLFAKDEKAPMYPLDLVKTLTRSIRLVEESIKEKGIELKQHFEIELAPFKGEDKRLQQSFLNLILNAEQSIEKDGRIMVSISSVGSNFIIEFADNGAGIPKKDIDKVFEPFYTTKTAGSGLGLAIVKKVVEAHGGYIDVKSRQGVGTTVTITLPHQSEGGK